MQALPFLINVMHPNILPLSSFVIAISRNVKNFIIEKHCVIFFFLFNLNQNKRIKNTLPFFAISKGKNE